MRQNNVSSLWGTSCQPVRCHRAPRPNITRWAQTVSVNVFPPEKRFVTGGAADQKPPKCTILHNLAQSRTIFAGTPDAIGLSGQGPKQNYYYY